MAERDEVVARAGAFQPSHRITRDVRGWLEQPAPDAIAQDCLTVSGWAFSSGSPIVEVHAHAHGSRQALRYGLRRDDVAQVYDGEPAARQSGFSGYLEFERAAGAPVHLRVEATLADGRLVTLFERRIIASVTMGAAGSSAGAAAIQFAARQAVAHPRLLLSPRSWINAAVLLRRAWRSRPRSPAPAASAREPQTQAARRRLARFLGSSERLTLTPPVAPVVSVILVVWNRADLTLACLTALAQQNDVPTEIVVVDNASTDETSALLSRIGGIRVVSNAENLGFTLSANIGAHAARGEFLLFLNNDAEVTPGSIAQLVATARGPRAIGAVGGKLVFPDGRLQEAGAIIWADGACDAYGRGDDPTAPEYNFERDVDFCSAALLLTPRARFESIGGFDERYQPAYYEDADYCVRLWARGYPVVYQPKAVAIHHEFGSAVSSDASIDLQRARRPLFVSLHGQWLAAQYSRDAGVRAARSHPHGRPLVVVVDDAVPDPRKGAGFPRAAALLRALIELGYHVTIYVTAESPSASTSRISFPTVEVVAGGPGGLAAFFASGRGDRCVIVSRPHNMQYVKAAVGSGLSSLGPPCIYDAEAVFSLREISRRRALGQPMPESQARDLIAEELRLTRGCRAVLVVSEAERELCAAAGVPNVSTLSHAVEIRPTPAPCERRSSILFVGAFSAESPNEDAVRFFCRDVLPVLRTGGCEAPLVVAGARIPESLKTIGDPTIRWRSDAPDLTPFYDDARVFIAPTRYSAGIPLKVIEAAAQGVPVVCTTLVANQLGWAAGEDLLAADGPEDFARAITALFTDARLWQRLRDAGLNRVSRDYNAGVFRSALRTALDVSVRPSAGAS